MSEQTKVIYFMTGSTLTWVTTMWQGDNNITSYEQLITLFHHVFDHAPEGKEVSKWWLSLKQGHGKAAEYTQEFTTVADKSG